jgi:hypothetical protein
MLKKLKEDLVQLHLELPKNNLVMRRWDWRSSKEPSWMGLGKKIC